MERKKLAFEKREGEKLTYTLMEAVRESVEGFPRIKYFC
jgi:hypothetical protein